MNIQKTAFSLIYTNPLPFLHQKKYFFYVLKRVEFT